MAKKQTPKPKSITLTYDLFELPTSQHRAGLAGLLLQLESMSNRGKAVPTYHWDEQQPNTQLHVTFTEETTAALFDDLYDAAWIEGPPRDKPYTKGSGEAKQEVPCVRRQTFTKPDKKGGEKTIEGYVYLELTPALATLRQYLPDKGGWVRLWQDLIWQVIRDSKKKAPYIQRAAAKALPAGATIGDDAEGSESEDEEKGKADGSTWADLLKYHVGLGKQEFATGKLSSALLLGAQSKGAEELPFVGRIDQNLLLHFWPMTCLVYVPRFMDVEGNSHIGRRNKEDKSKHFCLAIPDVSDPRGFVEDYRKVLAGLNPDVAVFRPKEALIDIVAEGGLSFVEHLARLTPQVAGGAETRSSVAGIDYLHLAQEGKIVRTHSTGRVAYSKYLAEEYRAVAGAYANPMFRSGRLLALIEDRQWYQPFGKLFAEWDVRFFVPDEEDVRLLNGRGRLAATFSFDAFTQFRQLDGGCMESSEQSTSQSERHPDIIVYDVVRMYVLRRSEAQLKRDGAAEPDWKTVTAQQTKADTARGAFLALRSRRDQAFIEHFTELFAQYGQYLPAPQDFLTLTNALHNDTERVKTVTLLALSANAYVSRPKTTTSEEQS
jgi:CRISPR-associated protein Cmx8